MTEEGSSVPAQLVEITSIALGQQYVIPPNSVLKLTHQYPNGVRCVFLAGGNPGESVEIHAVYTNSQPELAVDHGWSYLAVIRPAGLPPEPPTGGGGRASVTRVSAAADGTRFFVQEGDGIHRAVLLAENSNPPGAVSVILDQNETNVHSLVTANTYYEFLPGQNGFNDPIPVVPGSEVGELVKYVEAMAVLAGVG
mgnify:FL=1